MRIFVTGMSGFFGHNAALSWANRHEVWGSYLLRPIRVPGNRALHLNLNDAAHVHWIFHEVRPDIVIHAAALTDVDACEQAPMEAYRVNVLGTRSVVDATKSVGARLIYLSTDQLFDGAHEWYRESDAPSPVNVYGKTKQAAEQSVLETLPDALVIRTNFFGWGLPHRPSFSDWGLAKLRSASAIPGLTDVFFSPILVNDLLDRIETLSSSSASGLLHLAGADRLSKYSFLQELARSFDLATELVQCSTVRDLELSAPRPRNMAIASERLAGYLNSRPPSVLDGLGRLRQLEQSGWPTALAKLLPTA